MEAAAWGFIGTLLGALASIGTTLITSRNAAGLQSAAGRLARFDQSRRFQLDTLIALQDQLAIVLRLTARIHFEDVQAFQVTGNWGVNFLSQELNEAHAEAMRSFGKLVERVESDAVRAKMKQLSSIATRVTLETSRETSIQTFEELVSYGTEANESVGSALRAQL